MLKSGVGLAKLLKSFLVKFRTKDLVLYFQLQEE